MDIKGLMPFILVLVLTGMLLGVGVLTLDKYSRAVRTTTTVTDADINVSSGAATLAQTYCLSITTITNATAATTWDKGVYNVSFTDADACVITSDLPVNILYNVTYTYGAVTVAATTATNTNTAITPIASTWLPLIVTVFILAIIMAMVIGSFTGRGKR